jgi:hypothetical protein
MTAPQNTIDADRLQAFEKRWEKYRVEPDQESAAPVEDNEDRVKSFEKRWESHLVPESDIANYEEEPEQNAALALGAGTLRGIGKGLAKAGTGALGFLTRLGAAHLEETEPEEKYLTQIMKTGKSPETDRYEKHLPSKQEVEHKLERALIPKWLSAKRSGLQGKTEDVLERFIPKILNDAVFSGGNPWIIGGGIVGEWQECLNWG